MHIRIPITLELCCKYASPIFMFICILVIICYASEISAHVANNIMPVLKQNCREILDHMSSSSHFLDSEEKKHIRVSYSALCFYSLQLSFFRFYCSSCKELCDFPISCSFVHIEKKQSVTVL